jgi:hypothetical protein
MYMPPTSDALQMEQLAWWSCWLFTVCACSSDDDAAVLGALLDRFEQLKQQPDVCKLTPLMWRVHATVCTCSKRAKDAILDDVGHDASHAWHCAIACRARKQSPAPPRQGGRRCLSRYSLDEKGKVIKPAASERARVPSGAIAAEKVWRMYLSSLPD